MVSSLAAAYLVTLTEENGNPHLFRTGTACFSCHNGLTTESGEDISIGTDWSASMMANSARDPYWQAAVRREVIDHPSAAAKIENECATCHMPMAQHEARVAGESGSVFEHLPIGQKDSRTDHLAADGVSCTVCHQITSEGFGSESSFTGGFAIDTGLPLGNRAVFGPYEVDPGLRTIMHSATGFRQEESVHIQKSELCATCHTLITEALGPDGEVIGHLPEQVPFLEWQHSDFRQEQTCQSCHMPVVAGAAPISSVLGKPREDVSRHVFQGGNFFMLRMLNRYRNELGVTAHPSALEASAIRTEQHLQSSSARLHVASAEHRSGELDVVIRVDNLAGHKLPTGYPSRRVWLHFAVLDMSGEVIFESGKFDLSGRIEGNDNDNDPTRFEPHYDVITSADQVQIFESMMMNSEGQVTTGLLSATGFVKDNRLLPRGFDKRTAGEAVAVQGIAADDANFAGGTDQVRYRVSTADHSGPFTIRAVLWYQPISFRWANNLKDYDASEITRFTGYYDAMAASSALELTRVEMVVNTD